MNCFQGAGRLRIRIESESALTCRNVDLGRASEGVANCPRNKLQAYSSQADKTALSYLET